MNANERQVGGNHYKSPIEHWDYVIANDIPYLEAQVIKYLTRWRKKNGLVDVLKAKHFLDKLIEVETAKAQAPEVNPMAMRAEMRACPECGIWNGRHVVGCQSDPAMEK